MSTSDKAPALADTEKGIIDPNGLSVFRLTMMVITASVCGGIFSLAGDLAAGGANTAAVLVSWVICFVGVLTLALVFYGLSRVRPNLTGGIYAYAAAAFGKYVGFNSAWGYWISSCLTNAGYAIMLFSALGYFFPVLAQATTFLLLFAPLFSCGLSPIWYPAVLKKQRASMLQ